MNPDLRLGSWKEIAAYLKRDVRTLYRWEKEGLPVHRVLHRKRGNVYAYRSELDAWLNARSAELERELKSRRAHRLVIAGTASVVLLGLAAVLFVIRGRDRLKSPTPRRLVIAVLPFENLSGDPGQDYFSDGLTEEVITQLGALEPERLGVIARGSAMQYKHSNKAARQIGGELGVDYILEGSVLRAAQRARINVQLIQVQDQTNLWAKSYERELRDILSFHSDIARDVARQIEIKLTPQKEASLNRARSVDPEAHEAYLKGLYFWNKVTEDGVKKSMEYFRQAIDKDPGYALAYVGLAAGYNLLGNMNVLSPADAYPKMKLAAEKALELDDTLGEAHAALAWCRLFYDWDFPAARKEFERAIELNENYANAHQGYAAYFVSMGQTEEALAEIRKAEKLDPLSLVIKLDIGWILLTARRPDAAIEEFQKLLEMDPNFSMTHLFLGWAYDQKAMWDRAIAEDQKVTAVTGTVPSLSVARAYAAAGDRLRASDILARTMERSRREYVSPYHTALVYAALGDKDRAFLWLDRAYRDRFWRMALLKSDSRLDSLRSDPRFTQLLGKIGLPQ